MTTVFALHGFLGSPDDWHEMFPDAIKVDILKFLDVEHVGMQNSASKFNTFAKGFESPRVMVGYSLGGRLAMHALIDDPSLWSAAIIISSHLGLKTPLERQQRLETDQEWADSFLTASWLDLMTKWNAQKLFAGENIPREESNYCRKQLSDVLKFWSLGHQEDLKTRIEGLQIPILWIAGEKDLHFSNLAKVIRLAHPKSQISIVPKVGHRVPWSNKNLFQNLTQKFINEILKKEQLCPQ
jgi:2-succinyl-6-hydroxy-2,4-cyclohexadiene-1-carboxylate synthase